MSMLFTPLQNRNICDEIEIKVEGRKKTMHSKKCFLRSDVDDRRINLRLVALQELLGTYFYGIPMSRLSWLERAYRLKFNKSLDCKSLGVNNIKELVQKMHYKGMVLLLKEPESKKVHVMSARMVKARQDVYLKPNVQTLLDRNSGVIEFTSFEDLYEQQFQVKLNYFQYGLTNLDHLCKVLNDILMVEEADPPGAKVIKAKKRKYYSMKKKCLPRLDVDVLIDQRLVELEELLGNYCYGIPLSCLCWLERVYMKKFNKSLDCKSLGVNSIKELVEKMRDKGMVLLFEEPESKNLHVMSARMVKARQDVYLKPNVQTLLESNSGVIDFTSFEDLYKRQFNVKLNYFQYGLTNLDHLCKVLNAILMVEEADPPGAKVIKAKNRKYYSKKNKCLPRLDVDVLIDQRLVELEELLGNYCYGIPLSCLSWLERVYLQKFNKSLDCKSLGVNNIKELVEKMRDKGMVLLFEEPESKKVHVMSARMVKARQDVSLKPNVQALLESNSGVIEFTSFEDLYKRQFQVKLNYFQYGLTNLDHLCKVLNDILAVEADPQGAKVIMLVNKKRKYTNMSMLSSPQQNRNICDQIEIKEDQKKAMHSKKDVDVLIDQRLVELEALLGTYDDGIPMSNLSPLYSGYKEKFNKLLECNSLGVNDIKELVEKMCHKGMVVLVKGSKGKHVMSARMVEIRQDVFLKLNVQKLLRRHSGEIEFESFEVSYEEQFKVKLNYLWYGLTDLDDLCEVLKDILVVEEANPSRVKVIKAVKNATIQGKGRMTCAPQSVHSSTESTQSSDFYHEILEVLGDFYLGISLSHWSMFEYCYKLKFNKSLKSLGVTDFTQLLRVMGERVVSFVEREWEEEYVMSAPVANFRREICLKPNVEKLLYTRGGEIEFDSFENSYEDQFKDELFYGYYGLTDLDHLCQIFENILVVEEKGKKVIKAVKGMYNLRKKKK